MAHKERPQLTENRAKAMQALLNKIPASLAVDPDVKAAIEFIAALSDWRLRPEVEEARKTKNAKIYQWKLEHGRGPKNPGIGQGKGPKPRKKKLDTSENPI